MSRLVAVAGAAAVGAVWMLGGAPGAASEQRAPDLQSMVDAAEPGDEVRVPAGTYRGGIVIDEPIRLVAEPGAVVDGGGAGTVIEVRAPDVSVEGFVVRGSGDSLDHEDAGISVRAPRARLVGNHLEDVLFGVFLRGADRSVVTGNTIGAKDLPMPRRGDGVRLWHSSRVLLEGNRVLGGRDTVVWFSQRVIIRDNHFVEGRYGLHYMYAHRGVIEGNRFDRNSVGAFLMFSHRLVLERNVFAGSVGPSGYGLGFKDCDGADIEGNRFVGNRVGVYVDGSPFSAGVQLRYRRNVFAFNDVGVELQPSVENNVFSENAFVDNREQVGIAGGGDLEGNEWAVDGVGNHWSDYAGYDADADGIGDLAYRSEGLFSDLTDRHEALRFLSDTPAARAVDLAARAFPTLRPDPKVVDGAPLVDLPDLPPVPDPGPGPSRVALGLLSAALLGGAALVVTFARAWARPRRPRAAARFT